MHSFLIIHAKQEILRKKADTVCATYRIHAVDQAILSSEKSIGIEDIRNLQKNLSLSPLKSPVKAAIILHAHTMTTDAQNAFLKTLEEPPAHTIIMLLAKNIENFLPTIISRCTIMQEQALQPELSQKETDFYDFFFQSLPSLSLGETLKYGESLGKNKEIAITSLEAGIVFARKKMLQTNTKEWSAYIRQFQKTHALLTYTNANPRLAMEHLLLDLV